MDSASEFAYYLNKMKGKEQFTKDNVDEYIMSLDTDEYRLLLILIRAFQIYILRGLPEPRFVHSGNLYQLLQKDLQICYHTSDNLKLSFLDPKIKTVVFIRSKNFKETNINENGFDITYIQHDQMIIPFLDPQILSVKIVDNFQLYDGVDFDKKAPQILFTESYVAKIGAKIGQVIRFELLMLDKLPYIEYHYRIVTKKQIKTREVQDDDADE